MSSTEQPNEDFGLENQGTVEHSLSAASDISNIAVQFLKLGDRFRHQAVCEINGASKLQSVCVLRSIERPGESISSPPLQQIVTEIHGDSKVVLAVGQANKNHWSGSIGQANGPSDLPTQINFEFACRVNQKLDWLGSIYQIADQVEVDCPNSDENHARLAVGAVSFILRALPGSTLNWDESERLVTIRPESMRTNELPATVSWDYSISIPD